jgi:hypothetical protein
LILNPFVDFSPVGARVHRAQLELLREFLISMSEDMIRVAIVKGGFSGNLTIVGDWFGAKSLPPQPGLEYRQTIFSQHGPTVFRWVRDFDQELENNLREEVIKGDDSRDHAVKRIEVRLRELPAD